MMRMFAKSLSNSIYSFNCLKGQYRMLSFKSRPFQVAIDGPAASGKSTTAKLVAERLKFVYLDTGALYRALTLKGIMTGVWTDLKDISDQNLKLEELAKDIVITMGIKDGLNRIYLNGSEVTSPIRSLEVTEKVTQVARIPQVRKYLLRIQHSIAYQPVDNTNLEKIEGVVMEGRDIGSVVLPEAEVKIFLDADVKSRAERRFKELSAKGQESVELEEIAKSISDRDHADYNRVVSPLIKASDANVVDTSHLSIEEQVNTIIDLVVEKVNTEKRS